ncbi:MAG TPA: hypothetical protein VFX85_02050 [Solirubrobacterales bacterium]|nr:hypothetical protein [Solirubrobacterales bacterium]
MRKAKMLGLALVAMFSMSAVMAAGASADTLTATQYPWTLTGTSDGEFKDTLTTTSGSVICPHVVYHATIGAPIPTGARIRVTVNYTDEGCTGFGFPGTVDMNGCEYSFGVLAGTAGDVDLECAGANEVTMTARSAGILKCTVHVKTQTDIGGTVKYTNIAGGQVTVEANLTGIDYTHTQGTGLGSCPSGSATNGTLVAKAIFSAESDGPPYSPYSTLFSS